MGSNWGAFLQLITCQLQHNVRSCKTHHMVSIPYTLAVWDPGDMKVGGAGGGRGVAATPGRTPSGMWPGITGTGPIPL